eukprot:jgi/Hompol1/5627/HPOL_000865-RA
MTTAATQRSKAAAQAKSKSSINGKSNGSSAATKDAVRPPRGSDADVQRRRQETTGSGSAPGEFDSRHFDYLGRWRRSLPASDDDIAIDDIDEPHIKRRHAMLAAHPELAHLYGIEPSTKFIIVAVVALQLGFAYLFGRVFTDSAIALVVGSFVVGGTCTQIFGSLIHECAHGLVFESVLLNRIAGLVTNIGIPFPIAASFRRYHLEHHAYQGVLGKDPDLPLDMEIQLVRVRHIGSHQIRS